ncbi:unnamed protein product [Polarella glacialis]|uniref:Fibronectin type-III domain-containing protein n=1 Tax=Polarella glacialis TaxID=89957 RepID=A0A813FCX2_POLGL|nr:unnamed protein product [Polarella glacialis]
MTMVREACFGRYLSAARDFSMRVFGSQDGSRIRETRLCVKALFPNISDILAASSVHLRSGQPVVVRYRLAGACNYWHANHQVLKDEREPLPWPVPRKVLGETPFVALVPRGLRWTGAGGGGFYLGTQPFNCIDPGLRADLPTERESGQPILFGSVELVAPYLMRGTGRDNEAVQDFELRLFCSRKGRIIGCVGEPVPVKVQHQARPPPMASLQACCDGRRITLKWSALNLGLTSAGICGPVQAVKLSVKTATSEECLMIKAESAEYEMDDLTPDTEYDFHLRPENEVGAGREASCSCRTNSRCSVPQQVSRASASTTQVHICWRAPEVLGNEHTKDRFQLNAESTIRYEAKLKVEDPERLMKQRLMKQNSIHSNKGRKAMLSPKHSKENYELTDDEGDAALSRRIIWQAGSWNKNPDGSLIAKLAGLRPDTLYGMVGFCAVNSMGLGVQAKDLQFWTMPQVPQIVGIRVRQGLVILTLSQTGGSHVTEFAAVVTLDDGKEETVLSLPEADLRKPEPGSDSPPELPLPFEKMPASEASDLPHYVKLRAKNPGGWSEWSRNVQTVAIARQQGADVAQAMLVQAMDKRQTEELAQVLRDVRDIEFSDNGCYVEQASELLRVLESEVCNRLDSARGIEELKLALKAGYQERLPAYLIQRAVERLGTLLTAALETAQHMHLPSEEAARGLLRSITLSEDLLKAALETGAIPDLAKALESATKSLREDELIAQVSSLNEARFPEELSEALKEAARSQVSHEEIEQDSRLLHHLKGVDVAVGPEVPPSLLAAAENQLSCLLNLHAAIAAGDVPATYRTLRLAYVVAGVKEVELSEPRKVQKKWSALVRKVEMARSFASTSRLKQALTNTDGSDICKEQLAEGHASLQASMGRDEAEVSLREAIQRCDSETLQTALHEACDADVRDRALLATGRSLLHRLLHLRVKLTKAIESMDLERLHTSIQESKDALADTDMVRAKKLLLELQEDEFSRLDRTLKHAKDLKDFRTFDGFLVRAELAAQYGVAVHELDLEGHVSDWPGRLDQNPYNVFGVGFTEPQKELDIVNLPSSVVSGEIQLDFFPRGITEELMTLPSEIVEAHVKVLVEGVGAISDLLAPEDELRRMMTTMSVLDDGAHLHVAVQIAIYLRAQNTCRDVIEAFFRSESLEEDSLENLQVEVEDVNVDVEDFLLDDPPLPLPPLPLRRCFGAALQAAPTAKSKSIDEFSGARRHAQGWLDVPEDLGRGCLFNVCGRVLRKVTFEVSWLEPTWPTEAIAAGAFCFAMDGDHLVDIVSARSLHGAQYGIDQTAFRVTTKGVDALFGGVRHLSFDKKELPADGGPNESRAARHSMQLRLDLLPERVTDLFFLLSSSNARDLVKACKNISCTIVDAEIGAQLAKFKKAESKASFEAVILCAMYKMGDGRWRVASTNITCSGSARDFKPAINKLLELGYPRNLGMAGHENVILDAMRKNLELRRHLKPTAVTIVPSTSTLCIEYVIECWQDGEGSQADALVRKIHRQEFHAAVCEAVASTAAETVKPEHLRVSVARARPLSKLLIQSRWEFPEIKRNDLRDHSYLDGAVFTFAKQCLQEVIDYRGSHGVRIVHNGVIDYNGVWLGPIGIGDATDDAVRFAGIHLDDLPRTGKCTFEVNLDGLPPNTTDLYVTMSSPSGKDMSKYSHLVVALMDADNPLHEVVNCVLRSKPQSEGLIFCRLARASQQQPQQQPQQPQQQPQQQQSQHPKTLSGEVSPHQQQQHSPQDHLKLLSGESSQKSQQRYKTPAGESSQPLQQFRPHQQKTLSGESSKPGAARSSLSPPPGGGSTTLCPGRSANDDRVPGEWSLGAFRSSTDGSANDLRPVIKKVRDIQRHLYVSTESWPHQMGRFTAEQRAGRKCRPQAQRRKSNLKRQASNDSVASLLGWSPSHHEGKQRGVSDFDEYDFD